MKYHTVSIRLSAATQKWEVTLDKSDTQERVETKTAPNWLGFFHYPETMTDAAALKTLKKYLTDREREAIRNCVDKISDIHALKLPKGDTPHACKSIVGKSKVRAVKGRRVRST